MLNRLEESSLDDDEHSDTVNKPIINSLSTQDDNNSKMIITSDEPPKKKRDVWENQCEFFFSVLGYAVDLANIWRFPYVCYTNGGGAFLIPYLIVLITSVMPIFYLELLIGQSFQRGAIAFWDIFPIFKGIGIAQVIISYVVSFYYITIMAWCLYFVILSFADVLPWSYCDPNLGNTPRCINLTHYTELIQSNVTVDPNQYSLSSTEFFERVLLRIQDSTGIDNIGSLRWQITCCTIILFGLLYFVSRRGVRGSGKIVFFTAVIPYVFLLALLINALTLKGSVDGIVYLLKPQFDRLLDRNVWSNAAIQIFFSAGAGFGVHIAYAAHNPRTYNCFRDCIVVSIVNALSSLLSGITVFAYLGYMAYYTNSEVSEVVSEGPGLAFQVYPFAISTLPVPALWSILFFLLIISLGIDSLVGGIESVITGITDLIPTRIVNRKYYRPLITLIVVGISCLISFVNTTRGGMYVFSFMDRFVAGTSLLAGSLAQVIVLAWIYGLDKLCEDFKTLHGAVPGIYWRICWKFLTPITLTAMVITTLIDPPPLRYYYGTTHPEFLNGATTQIKATLHGTDQHYDYPYWAYVFGWIVTTFPMAFIPVYAIYYLIVYRPSFAKPSCKRIFSIGPIDFCRFKKTYTHGDDDGGERTYVKSRQPLPELTVERLEKQSNHINPA